MPIPMEVPGFRDLLASLTLTPIGDRPNLLVSQATRGGSVDGTWVDPEIRLWFENGAIDPEALFKIVGKDLSKLMKRPASEQLPRLVVAAAVAFVGPGKLTVETLNKVLSSSRTTGFSQWFVLPPLRGSLPNLSIGAFRLGELELDKLAYACRKARSDFYQVWEKRLHQRQAIRRINETSVLSWIDIAPTVLGWPSPDLGTDTLQYRVVDLYFDSLSALLAKEFWAEFRSMQEPLVALGAPLIPNRLLRETLGNEMITVFRDTADIGSGWVCPSGVYRSSVDFAPVVEIPRIENFILQTFPTFSSATSELASTFRSFARMVTRAVQHRGEEHMDEAFLHYVVALDLAVGEKGESTKSVTRRISALAHEQMNLTFAECIKQVGDVYDARSKYVHQGKSPETARHVVEAFCKIVAQCLFRAASQDAACARTRSYAEWIKKVDLLAALRDAGDAVGDALLMEVGVAAGEAR